jgi:hypothetical protein
MKVAEKMLRVVTDWGIKESNKPVKHTPVLWKAPFLHVLLRRIDRSYGRMAGG